MSEARIPGIKTLHLVISDECRSGRGEDGAIDESLRRIRDVYLDILKFWADKPGVKFHVVLTVEAPPRDPNGS